MVYADLQEDGFLCNIREGCYIPPGKMHTCIFLVHSDPNPGCRRVTLVSLPASGEIGPFTYDSMNKLPVPDKKRTEEFRLEQLIQQEIRAMAVERLKSRGEI